jgi:N-acyl-D-amino-acid deacylase
MNEQKRALPVLFFFFCLVVLVLASGGLAAQSPGVDLLVKNGWVVDGTGNPAFRADVAVRGDVIVAMGKLPNVSARRVIDATGLHVAPGFIDMHSHADRELTSDDVEGRKARNLVLQGITTVVVGADGRDILWPISKEIAAYRKPGTALNVVPMVGHGTVRGQVMGRDYERPATAAEIEKMKALVREGMEEGAWGLGAGPEYRPGRFSTTEEIVELAKVVADYDGFYYSHQRSQSPLPRWQWPSILQGWRLTATDGMKETIRIGRESGIRVVGSHIKAKGPSTWGQSSVDISLVEQARAEGVQVYLDQYPYETFGGGPEDVFPAWGFAPPGTDRSGGQDAPLWRTPGIFANHKENLRKNLDDPKTGPMLRADLEHILDMHGGADRIVVVAFDEDPSLVGKTVGEIAKARGESVLQVLVDFAMTGTEENPEGALFRPIAGSSFDVENYMKQEFTATGTDAGISLVTRPGQHPRYYGSYPRKIGYYARDKGVISLAFAIRSSTGLPAQIIGLPDRGYVREGYKADLVVFDYAHIRDRATILEPDLTPEGIDYVLSNGALLVDGGKPTGALAGKVLDRNEVKPRWGAATDAGSK